MYVFQSCSLSSSRPVLPFLCPRVCSLRKTAVVHVLVCHLLVCFLLFYLKYVLCIINRSSSMKWILNVWAGKTLLKEEVSSSSLDGFYIDHPSHSQNIFLNVKDTVWSGIFFHSIKNHIFKTYALKIDNLVVFSVFTSLCHIITYKFQNISPVQKETTYPLSVAPHSSRSFRSWQPRIYLLSLETCLIVEVSYTWNLMMRGLLCLASFTKHNVHPYCIMCQYFIPFYGWIMFHYMDIYFIYPFLSWWVFGLFPPFESSTC